MRFQLKHIFVVVLLVGLVVTPVAWYFGIPKPSVEPISFDDPISPHDAVHISSANGNTFACAPPSDRVYKGPRWYANDNNPPVSAAEAIELAISQRKLLKKNKSITNHAKKNWELDRIALNPHTPERGYWYWIVLFSHNDKTSGESTESLTIVVLMDGTVVDPQITDSKSGGIF